VTDPTVSNVRMSARSLAVPREGLPPNTRIECFDGRIVTMHWDCPHLRKLYLVGWGNVDRWEEDPYHGGAKGPRGTPIGRLRTDDPAEAQAAFERGAEYVRTGEGP
jgi:hypothetical protein